MASAAEEFAADGVEAEHLASRSLDESDFPVLHLVESLVAAEVELLAVADAARPAVHGRQSAVEEAQRRVERYAVDAVVESEPEVVVGIEGHGEDGFVLQAVADRDMFGLSCLQVEEDDAVVTGAEGESYPCPLPEGKGSWADGGAGKLDV